MRALLSASALARGRGRFVVPAVAALLAGGFTPSKAFGQPCDGTWVYGAYQGVPGVGGGVGPSVGALAWWDPDGDGPLTLQLAVGGRFWIAGSELAPGCALFDGIAFTGLGANTSTQSWVINDIEVVGSDLFVCGSLYIPGVPGVTPIARWTGTAWMPHGGFSYPPSVFELANVNDELYAGGSMRFGAQGSPGGIARLVNGTWQLFGNGVNGVVWGLERFQGNLVIAGEFTSAGGVMTGGLARWDGVSWVGLGTTPSPTVLSVRSIDDNLFVGGDFASIGGVTASRIARWDGTDWHQLGSGLNGTANAIFDWGEGVVVGGAFTEAGGGEANRVAIWRDEQWSPLGSGIDNNTVSCLASDGEWLYAGGNFTSTSGSRASGIARWDGRRWLALAPGVGLHTARPYGDSLLVTGTLNATPRHTEEEVGVWDGESMYVVGEPLLGSATGNALQLNDVEVFNGRLFTGGNIVAAGDAPSGPLAEWRNTQWHGVAGPSVFLGGQQDVYALETFNGRLVFAGQFVLSSGGVIGRQIAAWDGTSLQPLGGGLNSLVNNLFAFDGNLYASGMFGGSSPPTSAYLNHIGRWDGVRWYPLGAGLEPGPVYALAVFDNQLVAGGEFTMSGSTPLSHVARWDGSQWHAFGIGLPGNVIALHAKNGTLYAGGWFNSTTNPQGRNISRWDGLSWQPMGTGVDYWVRTLVDYQDELVAVGPFGTADGRPSVSWARWTDSGVPNFVRHPQAQVVAEGGTLVLTAKPAEGYETISDVTCRWRRNGVDVVDGPGGASGGGGTVVGANRILPRRGAAQLVIHNVQFSDAGSFECVVSTACGEKHSHVIPIAVIAGPCDPIDFNTDTLFPDTLDITDFLTVFAGDVCSGQQPTDPPCNTDIDFNNDGLFPDTADIQSLLSVFGGGPCV